MLILIIAIKNIYLGESTSSRNNVLIPPLELALMGRERPIPQDGIGMDGLFQHIKGIAMWIPMPWRSSPRRCSTIHGWTRARSRCPFHLSKGDQRDLRDLCRYREYLALRKAQCIQRIKSHMRIHDQHLENGYEDFSTEKGKRMLRQSFPDDFILMSMLDDYVYFSNRCDKIDRMLGEEAYQTQEVKLLSTIPGIGRLTAIQLMSMIVDIDRFPTADKFRSFFGMSIRVMDSGGKVKHGHVTKKGDPMMRTILGRVLNQFLSADRNQSVVVYYDSHVDSLGQRKTRMACMNKILDIIFAVLKRGTPMFPDDTMKITRSIIVVDLIRCYRLKTITSPTANRHMRYR